MRDRPYAGVIREFLERRSKMTKGRLAKYYNISDIDSSIPTYSLFNTNTGLKLSLAVPIERIDFANLSLVDTCVLNLPIMMINFDWRSAMKNKWDEVNVNTDNHLGGLVAGTTRGFEHPSYRVVSVYGALDNMFRIMDERRKKVVDKHLRS